MNESARTPLRVGRVTLNVNDLDRVRDFYRDVVGLEALSADRAAQAHALDGAADHLVSATL